MTSMRWIQVVGLGIVLSVTASAGAVERTEIQGEAMVALKPGLDSKAVLTPTIKAWEATLESVLESADLTIVKVSLPAGVRAKARFAMTNAQLRSRLQDIRGVLWVEPNYQYTGDIKDSTPVDPKFKDQNHHVLMDNITGWDTEAGSKDIVVAVTDDGTNVKHEDLVNQVWKNPGEIPGNGIDDDGNGFVDDIHGWNFVDKNANVEPDDVEADAHGTHVAGIVAAEQNNNKGVSGTAPGVRVMILKWLGANGGFTSDIVAKSFLYAANNGAKIITTSYNVDGFVNDKVYAAALDAVYAKGVLQLNSAGNNNKKDPPRQVFTQMVLVCSTESISSKADVRSSFSNYGLGVDVCSPGSDILSTLPNDTYGRMSGTSMATPNAAGTAALIWSRHPNWTRDQVAAQLVGTTDNIDGKNATYKGLLGSGRVNSNRAVTETLAPPTVAGLADLDATGTLAVNDKVRVALKRVFDGTTVMDPAAWDLTDANGKAVDFTVSGSYRIGSNDVTLTPKKALSAGSYRLVAKASQLRDPFGLALDGNGDGKAGDDYAVSFKVK